MFIMGPDGNYKHFRITQFGQSLGAWQTATGIDNESHLIIGWYTQNTSYGLFTHGFTYDYLSQAARDAPDGAAVTVNTFDYPGAVFVTVPTGINSHGVISGNATTPEGFCSFIATPAP